MAEENVEICGFLDVKYFRRKSRVHKVTKRTLGSWKVWNKHWCSIRKLGPGLGIKVQIDCAVTSGRTAPQNEKDNSITIPFDAVIYRTQSRSKQFAFGIFPSKERKPLLYLAGNSEIESQHWMTNIRQLLKPRKYKFIPGSYNVSIIDNAHSKASGLTGLHGDLLINTIGIIIKDVHSGEIVENIEWDKLAEFHLTTAGQPDDVKCICVIHTTNKFRGGVGELYMFCLEATKLLYDLVTHGRGPRQRQINRRPLSLSEGDLRVLPRGETSRSFALPNERMELKVLNKRKENHENYEDENMKIISFKNPIKLTEDLYQPEPHTPYHSRRISGISTASGIYEEIPEEEQQGVAATSSLYMNRLFSCPLSQEPPPLPPRQRCASDSMKDARSQNIRIPATSFLPLTAHRNSVQIERNNLQSPRVTDESNYVPMSPRLKDITLHNLQMQAKLQENDYVSMR